MSRLTQLRAWWHRWREEFYEDNPISWLAGWEALLGFSHCHVYEAATPAGAGNRAEAG
jgi:hypothetical protein